MKETAKDSYKDVKANINAREAKNPNINPDTLKKPKI